MARYRLPEALGGGEIEADETWGGCPGGRPTYAIAGEHITITMPEGTPLDRVTPPEPPIGAIVRAKAPGGGEAIWTFEHAAFARGEGWYTTGATERYRWADLCADFAPVRLVEHLPDWERELLEGQR